VNVIKALLAFVAIFGKRALENLEVKKEDIWIDGAFIYVRFKVLKKMKRRKICKGCLKRNPLKALLCAYCGMKQDFTIETYGDRYTERVKHKRVNHPLSKYIITQWKKVPVGAFMFPPLNRVLLLFGEYKYVWNMRMSYKTMWALFHKLTELSPHGFRHSLATKLAQSGEYDELDLLYWFDWESFDTARKYIHLGGGKRVRKVAEYGGKHIIRYQIVLLAELPWWQFVFHIPSLFLLLYFRIIILKMLFFFGFGSGSGSTFGSGIGLFKIGSGFDIGARSSCLTNLGTLSSFTFLILGSGSNSTAMVRIHPIPQSQLTPTLS
jgi:hypothetical protein